MKLHILIGPARSGKTTFIHQHMTDKDAHISVTQNDVFIERASKEAIHSIFGFKNDKADNLSEFLKQLHRADPTIDTVYIETHKLSPRYINDTLRKATYAIDNILVDYRKSNVIEVTDYNYNNTGQHAVYYLSADENGKALNGAKPYFPQDDSWLKNYKIVGRMTLGLD